jgi:hypothetical protein
MWQVQHISCRLDMLAACMHADGIQALLNEGKGMR